MNYSARCDLPNRSNLIAAEVVTSNLVFSLMDAITLLQPRLQGQSAIVTAGSAVGCIHIKAWE
jgi:hypothetical protein